MKNILDKLKRILFTVKVYGESCWPELIPSKRYLATGLLNPKVGDYIVFKTKYDEIFVKKVKEIKKGKDDSYLVSGTVSWSDTSKNLGMIKQENVLGKLVLF
ncbi:TPA: hypothetical protein HA246_02225 [Candidatus Woesearchaeota archaeon]|nr:hypothetical protein [Candidatus Woesearchaeota archaeon]